MGVGSVTTAHALSTAGPTRPSRNASFRKAEGLYDPAFEHDACGVAFVATLDGVPSNAVVAKGLQALRNLDHRGAVGSDPKTGDGAGMLLQIPDGFFRSEVEFELPRQGAYAVGNAFLPTDPELACEGEGQHRADRGRGELARTRLAPSAYR
jgi:glutamate synthase domain-containing protein 1